MNGVAVAPLWVLVRQGVNPALERGHRDPCAQSRSPNQRMRVGQTVLAEASANRN
jgi:hypothetical protein